MMMWKTPIIVIVLFLLAGCASHSTAAYNPMYFASPASAVEQITVMMKEKNWVELARYYDLADSSIDKTALINGEFFYTDEEPPYAHPAGFWRYKHPFSPGFKYHSSRDLEEPGIIEVMVQVEIDQGGGMVQRGLQTFLMRKTGKGYQVLPHETPAP